MKVLLASVMMLLPLAAPAQERVESGAWSAYSHPETRDCIVHVGEMHGRRWAFAMVSNGWDTTPMLSLWNGEMGPAVLSVDLVIDGRAFPLDFFKGRDSQMANASFDQSDPQQQFMEALAAGSKMSVVENGQVVAEFSLSGSRGALEAHQACEMGRSEGHPEG